MYLLNFVDKAIATEILLGIEGSRYPDPNMEYGGPEHLPSIGEFAPDQQGGALDS